MAGLKRAGHLQGTHSDLALSWSLWWHMVKVMDGFMAILHSDLLCHAILYSSTMLAFWLSCICCVTFVIAEGLLTLLRFVKKGLLGWARKLMCSSARVAFHGRVATRE